MIQLRRLVAKTLRELADKMDAGTTDITESEALEIFSAVVHEAMSTDQAYNYLNLSRSKFYELIAEGIIPKGKKVKGRSGLTWYKGDLDIVKYKLKKLQSKK